MAITEVSICNSALIKIGAERILSLEDDTRVASMLKDIYPIVRDNVLASHPWNFATDRAELAALVTAPLFDWSYQYSLPVDCLRVYDTDLPKDAEWKVESGVILCDYGTLKIKYIKRELDTSKYSAYFNETLSWALATSIAYAVTQSNTLKDSCEAAYERQLRVARSYDAQEGSGDRVYANTWLNSRA